MERQMFENIKRLDHMARMGQIPGVDSVRWVGAFRREKSPEPIENKPQQVIEIKPPIWTNFMNWCKRNKSFIKFLIATLIGICGIFS